MLSGIDPRVLLRVRAAVLVGAVGPEVEYMRFLVRGVRAGAWSGELGGFFVLDAAAGGLALAASLVGLWLLGYPCIRFASRLVHHVLAKRVRLEEWDRATDHCLWP